MRLLLWIVLSFLTSSALAIDGYEVSGGLGVGYYADALGWGPHVGAGVAFKQDWVVGVETGLFFFGNSRSNFSHGATAEVSARVIPILLTGRYIFRPRADVSLVYYAGLSAGVALIKETSSLSVSGTSVLNTVDTGSTIMALGKVGMESPLLRESKLTGYAEIQAGAVRDIFAGFLNAGMRLGF